MKEWNRWLVLLEKCQELFHLGQAKIHQLPTPSQRCFTEQVRFHDDLSLQINDQKIYICISKEQGNQCIVCYSHLHLQLKKLYITNCFLQHGNQINLQNSFILVILAKEMQKNAALQTSLKNLPWSRWGPVLGVS